MVTSLKFTPSAVSDQPTGKEKIYAVLLQADY